MTQSGSSLFIKIINQRNRFLHSVNRYWKMPECSAEPLFEIIPRGFKIKVVEIGTRYGESAVKINREFAIGEYICVDPYVDYEEYEGDDFSKVLKSDYKVFKKVSRSLKLRMGSRVKFIREFSEKAASQIDDNYADFIFIDGNHAYEYVHEDLRNYWPKVKSGGILAGHDYWHRSISNGGHFDSWMVFEAVKDFADEYGISYLTYGQHGEFPACFAFIKGK